MSGQLSTYGELADVLVHLPRLLRETRRARRLSLRAVAREVGIAFNTDSRIELGQDVVLSNAITVLRWLDHEEGEPEGADCG